MQLDIVREAHEKLTRESAENEATMKEQMKRTRSRAHEVKREAELNQTKAMELQANLQETQRVAKFEISNMKDELMNRRDKVYQLLEKLQVTEDQLRRSADQVESQEEKIDSSQERTFELDRRMDALRVELAERENDVVEKGERYESRDIHGYIHY